MKWTIEEINYELHFEVTQTTDELLRILPKQWEMQDLNQNEKYYTLPHSLPTNPVKVQRVSAGDVMLYGDQTLVIFYASFDTPYRYTRIGKLSPNDDFDSLKGSETVTVKRQNGTTF